MIYAIGDIHGQKTMLDRALALVAADGGEDARIVFLGDYTDRGPDSRAVIATLREGCAQGRNWVCLKGNHDRMFHRYVTAGHAHDTRIASGLGWLNPRLGGDTTLGSYGLSAQMTFAPHTRGTPEQILGAQVGTDRVTPAQLLDMARDLVPHDDLAFIDGLPLHHTEDGLLFVHAGIRPGVPLAAQAEDDLLWIREGFLDDPTDHGALVVHGHTALETPVHFGNRVDLDGGAGYGRPLVPAVFDGTSCWLLTESGRERLEA